MSTAPTTSLAAVRPDQLAESCKVLAESLWTGIREGIVCVEDVDGTIKLVAQSKAQRLRIVERALPLLAARRVQPMAADGVLLNIHEWEYGPKEGEYGIVQTGVYYPLGRAESYYNVRVTAGGLAMVDEQWLGRLTVPGYPNPLMRKRLYWRAWNHSTQQEHVEATATETGYSATQYRKTDWIIWDPPNQVWFHYYFRNSWWALGYSNPSTLDGRWFWVPKSSDNFDCNNSRGCAFISRN